MSGVVVAKRVDAGTPDTEEIRDLVRAAGYEVVGEITQIRTEDAALCLGEGKVRTLAATVRETDAERVVFDNELGPYQTYNLGSELPDGIEVLDRFRLILEIFGQRANTRKAQLQVELAELRYELPRVEAKVSLARRDERPGFMGLGEYDESREQDIKAQISNIREELDRIEGTEAKRRKQRRESGFDLVALAGYTNAGKSTLDSVYRADLVLLVVDVSEPVEEIREKLVTCHDTLYERNEAPIVTILNKTDRVTDEQLRDTEATLSALAPNPVSISALENKGIAALRERIERELPAYERERLVLPMADETMSLVSWIHDNARVEEVDYGEQVVVDFEARPAIVERSRAKAGDLVPVESA